LELAIAALQNKYCCYAKASVVTGIWYTLYQCQSEAGRPASSFLREKEKPVSNTASATLHAPSAGLLSRLFATIDRLLLAYADMTIRTGDIPRHGI